MHRVAKFFLVVAILASVAGSAFAQDDKAALAKEALAAEKSAPEKALASKTPAIFESKEKLGEAYKNYHSKRDCDGLQSLVEWRGIDISSKELFSGMLCYNGYEIIKEIAFKPVDPTKLELKDAGGTTLFYSIPPEVMMLVTFKPQKMARNTAPGKSPELEFMIAKNQKGSYVIVAPKRKS